MIREFSDKQVDELRGICRKVYGQEFTYDEAREMAHRLFVLYDELKRRS